MPFINRDQIPSMYKQKRTGKKQLPYLQFENQPESILQNRCLAMTRRTDLSRTYVTYTRHNISTTNQRSGLC